MKEKITLTVFCEKQETLISKIVLVFTRKKINIDQLEVSICELTSLYRIKIIYWDFEHNTNTMKAILERFIEVFCCFTQNQKDSNSHQVELFKIPLNEKKEYSHYPISYLFQEKNDWICCAKIPNEDYQVLQKTLQSMSSNF